MNRHAPTGVPVGFPYDAVGIQSALASAIGLPMRSTNASWMLAFLMPADVSSNFMVRHEAGQLGGVVDGAEAAFAMRP